jgi:DNA gyrase inhibitor GyrI
MKTTLIIIVSIIVLLVVVYAWYGGFKSVTCQVEARGGETMVYKDITGPYKQSGVVMDEVYKTLLENGIETYKGVGVYYDNPQKVEAAKLRSEAGCIIEDIDLDKLAVIDGVFKTKVLPQKKYVVTEFPYKNKMSVLFSILKVYPALAKYSRDQGIPEEGAVMEIYDIPNKRILYRKEMDE